MDILRNSRVMFRITLAFILVAVLLISGITCVPTDPQYTLQIENRTNQTLSLYKYQQSEYYPDEYFIGDVTPGNTAETLMSLGPKEKIRITAKNTKGYLVYLRWFNRKEFEDIKYILVIRPSDLHIQK